MLEERRTPSTYGRTCTQKKFHTSTSRVRNFSSSIPVSFASRFSIPVFTSSVTSVASVAIALDGDLYCPDMWMLVSSAARRKSPITAVPQQNSRTHRKNGPKMIPHEPIEVLNWCPKRLAVEQRKNLHMQCAERSIVPRRGRCGHGGE